MSSEPVILEISSDEEGGSGELDDSSDDWFSEMLGSGNSELELSDDVLVLEGGSFASVGQKQNSMDSCVVKGGLAGDSDDDCLILDGDPDKPVSAVDGAENGSDDVLIVAEKGQLACRDYPHPRHLCAKFPFSSTPHENYCNLCHCYVCDSLAPCMYWGTGVGLSDHCNSTDKEEIWITQRKCFKQSKTAAAPVQKLPDTTLSMRSILRNAQPTHTLSEPPNLGPIPWQTSVSKPIELVSCPTTNFGRTAEHRPNMRMRILHSRSRHPQYSFRSPQLMPRTHAISKERGGSVVSGPLSSGVHNSGRLRRAVASRPSQGALVAMHQSARSSYGRNHVHTTVQLTNHSMQGTPGDVQLNSWQDFLSGIDSELSTFQNSNVSNSNNSSSSFPSSRVANQHQVQGYDPSFPQLEATQSIQQFVDPILNTTNSDQLDLAFIWPVNSATQNKVVGPTVESPANIQPEPQQLPQNPPRSSDFLQENWMHTNLDHQPPMIDASFDPLLADIDFLSRESSTVDPGMLFCELESPWVL